MNFLKIFRTFLGLFSYLAPKQPLSVKLFSFLLYICFNKTFLERHIKKESKLVLYLKNLQLFSTFLSLKTGDIIRHTFGIRRDK